MKDYKGPIWLAVLVFLVVFTANWYVNRDVIDKTDFNEVVHKNVDGDSIVQMDAFDEIGFVLTENEDELGGALFQKVNGNWNHLGSTLLRDGKWGFTTIEREWLYFGVVKEEDIQQIHVGPEKVRLYEGANSIRYWFHLEPNGYNYPIKAVKEDGSSYWIKEK